MGNNDRAAQRWEAFLHHWIWDAWRRYFRARGIVPVPPYCEPGKRYIFAHFPHAGEKLLPCAHASCLDTCCSKLPGLPYLQRCCCLIWLLGCHGILSGPLH